MTHLLHRSDSNSEHAAPAALSAIDWSSLQILAETANASSLRDAARRSGLSVATIIRHLERLEQAAGQPLYKRNEKKLILTEYGQSMRDCAIEIQNNIRFRIDSINERSNFKIRMSLDNVVNEVLLCYNNQRFFDLIADYNIAIDSFIDRQQIESADITMSLDRFTPLNSTLVRLCSMGFCTFASVEYIARNGIPRSKSDLGRHSFSLLEAKGRFEMPNISDIMARCPRIVTSNSQNIVLQSVLKGNAIGILPIYLVQNHAGIIPIDLGFYHERDIWLYVKKESRMVHSIDTLIKEIRNCFDERRLNTIKNTYDAFRY